MSEKSLKDRKLYLDKLIAFQDTDLIKVITGIRRCGKSSLMKLMSARIKNMGIAAECVLEINFESMNFAGMDDRKLYEYVIERVVAGKKMYLFFDEIQFVRNWQRAINSFRVDLNCDIYITGSNAYLLSSELSTYLAGRYVEIKLYPLSFSEFIDFSEFRIKEKRLPDGKIRKQLLDTENEVVQTRDVFDSYVRFGGMPPIMDSYPDQEKVTAVLDGIYSAVVVRDILERVRREGSRAVTDASLLRKLTMFLADNIGNNSSANSISKTLIYENLLTSKPGVPTVQAYMDALVEAYIFYEIKRFDIKGRDYLRTLGKHYIVDIGIRNYLLGFRGGDSGHVLENIVFFELLRRGYQVAVGKINNLEIDFIATKTDEKMYIQVTETMLEKQTRERELTPLLMIKDNYKKMVITMDSPIFPDNEGIQIVNALEWLLA